LRFIKKIFPFFFSLQISKMRYAYGISSIVPDTRQNNIFHNPRMQLHYPMFDCDDQDKARDFEDYISATAEAAYILYPSKHGVHAIIFSPMPFQEVVSTLLACPYVDPSYVAIGIKRGYWFLENHVPVESKRVTYMRIERTV